MTDLKDHECSLCDAKIARKYVDDFLVAGRKPSMVKISSGREIHFETMSDSDAILVAHGIYEMQQEAGITGRM